MTCRAPAKINLGLSIKGRRPNGYHELETVFYPIALHDMLEIEVADETSLAIEGILVPVENNLCLKAWALLRREVGSAVQPARIRLNKRIPTGAGLGGGSSNAAAVLRALNELCGLGLSTDALAVLAVRLGADVPFFLHDRPMLARGVGEVLTPFDLELPYEIRLVTPAIHSDTASAYRALTPADFSPDVDLPALLRRPVAEWRDTVRNDFEPSVFRRFPELAALKQALYDEGAVYAAMTGSGSALFGLFSGTSGG